MESRLWLVEDRDGTNGFKAFAVKAESLREAKRVGANVFIRGYNAADERVWAEANLVVRRLVVVWRGSQ